MSAATTDLSAGVSGPYWTSRGWKVTARLGSRAATSTYTDRDKAMAIADAMRRRYGLEPMIDERKRRKASGTIVAVVNSELHPDVDPAEGGPWATICEDHGGLCQHDSLGLARRHATDPVGWCPGCQEKAGR